MAVSLHFTHDPIAGRAPSLFSFYGLSRLPEQSLSGGLLRDTWELRHVCTTKDQLPGGDA